MPAEDRWLLKPQGDDWPLLSDELKRPCARPSSITAAIKKIIGRGKVPVFAFRSDIPLSASPERVEEMLTQAQVEVSEDGDTIIACYQPGQDLATILGPRSPLKASFHGRACAVTFRFPKVYRPDLIAALAVAGFNTPESALPADAEPTTSTASPPKNERPAKPRKPRRGPEPGSTGFCVADEALYLVIDQMRKSGKARSVTDAATKLDDQGKVKGDGTPASRVSRLARRYGKWKSAETSKR